ncbi:MAG TPA: response regulator [Oscillatoriaceae cyanobacterium M33_DOE_052]|uniref:histidine kinase n=1 Tax=Planktothricoides sp. SpSt-374 TaxID=2282167 RepID=A0A7C4A0I4_9CYAN|nr:response regulator [Oscillatoriaceae cyanobacterium M33_DOE_052]
MTNDKGQMTTSHARPHHEDVEASDWLTGLANLFGGDVPELDETWSEEEILDEVSRLEADNGQNRDATSGNAGDLTTDDFSDLLFDEESDRDSAREDLNWFGEVEYGDTIPSLPQISPQPTEEVENNSAVFESLSSSDDDEPPALIDDFEQIFSDEPQVLEAESHSAISGPLPQLEELNSLFDELPWSSAPPAEDEYGSHQDAENIEFADNDNWLESHQDPDIAATLDFDDLLTISPETDQAEAGDNLEELALFIEDNSAREASEAPTYAGIFSDEDNSLDELFGDGLSSGTEEESLDAAPASAWRKTADNETEELLFAEDEIDLFGADVAERSRLEKSPSPDLLESLTTLFEDTETDPEDGERWGEKDQSFLREMGESFANTRPQPVSPPPNPDEESLFPGEEVPASSFAQLDALLDEPSDSTRMPKGDNQGNFDDLEMLLTRVEATAGNESQVFNELSMLLTEVPTTSALKGAVFDQLSMLLEGKTTIAIAAPHLDSGAIGAGHSQKAHPSRETATLESQRALRGEAGKHQNEITALSEENESVHTSASTSETEEAPIGAVKVTGGTQYADQTMRVPVRQLDNLNNLVGELVVNRNSLEQNQERMRQFLDNMLHQVQNLADVGQRMQDLYERVLLEMALLAGRQGSHFMASTSADSSHGMSDLSVFDMDRFTPFHTQAQEILELIVRVRESASDIEFLVDETEQVTRQLRQVTNALQEGLTRSRMVPFSDVADRLRRGVRDKAIEHEKQVDLVIEGRDTLVDKMILENLYSPLTHLANNALAHGIETTEARSAKGKNPTGQITIRAFHQGNQTVIAVSDDGAGIDAEKVKATARNKRLISEGEARSMSRLDVYDLLFKAGFSTKDQADDLAGRGVGLDVVRHKVSEIRGAVTVDSALGKGTTFTIRLPLALSISKALVCISDRARIAFPMDGVEDMLDVPREKVQEGEEGQRFVPWRDTMLPFRNLRDLLHYKRHLGRGNVYGMNAEEDVVSVVVLRSAGNYLALQVDQVIGEQEIVIKQLEGPVPKPMGIAGATVMGDGRIVAIADVLEMIDLASGRIRASALATPDTSLPEAPVVEQPTVLIVDDSITVRELLSMTFNKAGYRVEQARDGQEAWEKMRSGLPCHLVFCDIEMPRMDGLQLLSHMQKDPVLCKLPIAMLTSRGADKHRQMAVSMGANGYFTKPYLEEALLEAAGRMLRGEVLVGTGDGRGSF